MCPGWQVCRDEEEWCAGWAAIGECKANPGYMLVKCPRSCSACPTMVPASHGLVGMDVRGGNMVDAVRLHCGPVEAADSEGAEAADGDGVEGGDGSDDDALVSDWFGGKGGDECALACDSANITDGWRTGGLIQSVLVAGGQRVDRLELARCSEDLEI